MERRELLDAAQQSLHWMLTVMALGVDDARRFRLFAIRTLFLC